MGYLNLSETIEPLRSCAGDAGALALLAGPGLKKHNLTVELKKVCYDALHCGFPGGLG